MTNAMTHLFSSTQLILYHGSDRVIKHPDPYFANTNNDYGRGFYCTEDLERAQDWAARHGAGNGYVNKYSLEMQDLAVLDLTSKDFTPLHWITMLINHRVLSADDMTIYGDSFAYLSARYPLDITKFDIAIGYRADDSYFSFTKLFLSNQLSLQALTQALNLGYLGKQIVLLSEEAHKPEHLQFISAEHITDPVYLKRHNQNDKHARDCFRELRQKDWQSKRGKTYIIDLMRKDSE